MKRNKKIYRGLNRRKRNRALQIASGVLICAVGGYGIYKISDMIDFEPMGDKLFSFDLPSFDLPSFNLFGDDEKENKEEFTYEDVEKELDGFKEEEVTNQDIKVTTVDGWKYYTIQVASIKKDEEYTKLEEELKMKKIPYSIVSIDDTKKIQTYGSLNKEYQTNKLEEVRKIYPDAFISEIEIPPLSLQYTKKYSYMEEISNQLMSLIKTFESESKFWEENNMDMEKYKTIMNNRNNAISNIKQQCDKIDYDGAKRFKENLISYMNELITNINNASKSANQEIYNESQSIFLSSMQQYYLFINSIQ